MRIRIVHEAQNELNDPYIGGEEAATERASVLSNVKSKTIRNSVITMSIMQSVDLSLEEDESEPTKKWRRNETNDWNWGKFEENVFFNIYLPLCQGPTTIAASRSFRYTVLFHLRKRD